MAGFPPKEGTDKGERLTLTKIFREFKGVNTKSDRTAIPAENFYDLVNLMPIGSANLHSAPDKSASLHDFGSDSIYSAQYANISNTNYLICFATDGKAFAYNIDTGSTSQINGSTTLSGSYSRLDQWKNQVILIVDSTGYYYWNGSGSIVQINTGSNTGILPTGTLTNPDIAVYNNYVWIVSNRVLYVSQPNQYASSAGTAITTSATFSSGATSVTAYQTQSALGNVVVGSTVIGTGIPSSTTVTSVNYNTGVVGISNATTSTGPLVNTTTATFSSGASSITVGSATGLVAGALVQGTGIPTGTVILASYVPGSTTVPLSLNTTAASAGNYTFTSVVYLTFSTTSSGWDISGGALIQNLTDPQYRGQVVRMLSASGYLYLFSQSSIFVISDVYIPTGAIPPSPAFSMVNVQALIGTQYPMSVFPVDRDLYFANNYGLWAMRGVSVVRISEDIDGTVQYFDQSWTISGGTAQVFNILNACFLIKQLNDPAFGTRVLVAMFFDKKWWFYRVSDLAGLYPTFICGGMLNNRPTLFGFIGNKLYTFATNTAASPAIEWQTALWAMEESLADKEVFRAGFEVTSGGLSATFQLTLDTPYTSTKLNPTSATANVQWINNNQTLVAWINNSSATVSWYAGNYLLFFADGLGGYGKYVGFTGTAANGAPFQITSNAMDYTLRKRW